MAHPSRPCHRALRHPLACLSLMTLIVTLLAGTTIAASVQLARQGQAAQTIHLAADASPQVKELADTLASYLQRITGGTFEVATGDGTQGLAVGKVQDFPALASLAGVFEKDSLASREQYLLRSHAAGLYVLGQTDLAVQHAVWDLLHRVGYRQYFPGQVWEIVPHHATLSLEVDTLQSPDYSYRNIWYGYGLWDYNAAPYRTWQQRNRAPGAFGMRTGHAYDNIIRRNKAAFDAHPEYYALVDGQRKGSKLCISNPGLQQVVLDYARDQLRRTPDSDSVSIDPSDGGGWCECEPCAALGTPSDRALILANLISDYLEEHHPDRFVAMYAYNEHSPPPTKVRAKPRVIINVATGFLREGHTTVGLLDAWRDMGVQTLGIREYYSVQTWDHDLPGRARGGNPAYLARTIPDFHRRGARFMSAESSDNWAPNGLGYYMATRMLWDVNEAGHVADMTDDFLRNAFGQAREPMARFYEILDGQKRMIVSWPLIGRMYTLLRDARALTDDPAILARLDHLTLYTRYVELHQDYTVAGGAPRQAAFEALVRHAYRMRETMMVHTKALYRDMVGRDRNISIPAEAVWSVPEATNPWKSSEPWTREELDGFIAHGIEAYPPLSFEPVDFAGDLKPAAGPLKLADQRALPLNSRTRGKNTYYLWIDQAPQDIALKVTGGLIKAYRDRGPVQLKLYLGLEDQATLIAEAEAPNQGQQTDVSLRARNTGLHLLVVSDGSDLSEVLIPDSIKRTFEMSSRQETRFSGRWSGYFYVPKGTRVIGGHAAGRAGAIHDAAGKRVHTFSEPGYFHVDVPAGQDGKLWSMRSQSGRVIFMTVPPYLSTTPAGLLLPEDVITQDAQ